MNLYPNLLFHPNIPKPLHGMAPRLYLGKEWWDRTKGTAKEKLNQHCWACGVHKTAAKYHGWLEAHECYSIDYAIGRVEYVGTCALCHSCHNYIHDGRMLILVQKGEFPLKKYLDILDHGNAILERFVTEQGQKWLGGKNAFEPELLVENYPFFAFFDKNLKWSGMGEAPSWDEYHMIINGEKYSPIHRSFEDWKRYYSKKSEQPVSF